MRAYQRYSKSYRVVDTKTEKVLGEYTTVDGCHSAMKRRGIEDYRIEHI